MEYGEPGGGGITTFLHLVGRPRIRDNPKNLAFACISPTFASLWGGWRTRSRVPDFANWWKTANQLNMIVRRSLICANLPSLYLSCFILYYLSNFSLGLCAFLSFISFISISIIGPNYTVQGDQTQMEIKSIIRWRQKKWRLYRFCSTRINVGVLNRSSRLVPATSPAWARPINLFPGPPQVL